MVLTYHADRVHVEQQASGTPLRSRFRVKDVRLAEAQVEALTPPGVLVQEETEIGGRRTGGRGTQEHASASQPWRRHGAGGPGSLGHGRDIPTKLPSFSRARAHRNAPTSGLS